MKPAVNASTEPDATPVRMSVRNMALGTVLATATAIAYLPAYRGGFIWDDDDYVAANALSTDADGFRRIWLEPGATPQYYPLVFSMFRIEHRLWGVDPLGYHAVNVGLHVLAALAVWGVVSRLGLPGAWLAGLLFAVHPVQVESVAWISERKNVLSCLLALLAVWGYIGCSPFERTPHPGGRTRRWLALLAFAAANLSKTAVCTLPVSLLLLTWWRRGRVGRRDLSATAPWFAMAAALGLVTVWVELYRIGAGRGESLVGWIDRFCVAGRATWFYLGKVLWPANLAFIYPRWPIPPSRAVDLAVAAAVVATTLGFWLLRRRFGRGLLCAWLVFIVTLSPALGLVNVNFFRFSWVADHFAYHAVIPIAVVVAYALTRGSARADAWRRPCGVAAVCAPVVLGVLTFVQAGHYRDAEALWRHALARNPGSSLPRSGVALALQRRGEWREALAHYEEALMRPPADLVALRNVFDLCVRQGAAGDAERILQRATQAAHAHPLTWYFLGVIQATSGRLDDAAASLERALERDATLAEAHSNLGAIRMRQGRRPEALAHLNRAVELDGDLFEARLQLAMALTADGQVIDAMPHYAAAARLRAEDAAIGLMYVDALIGAGRPDEASSELTRLGALPAARQNAEFRGELERRMRALRAATQPVTGEN